MSTPASPSLTMPSAAREIQGPGAPPRDGGSDRSGRTRLARCRRLVHPQPAPSPRPTVARAPRPGPPLGGRAAPPTPPAGPATRTPTRTAAVGFSGAPSSPGALTTARFTGEKPASGRSPRELGLRRCACPATCFLLAKTRAVTSLQPASSCRTFQTWLPAHPTSPSTFISPQGSHPASSPSLGVLHPLSQS